MATKLQGLVDSLFKSNPKVFYDRPDTLTSEAIKTELDERESKDLAASIKRLKAINVLFTETVTQQQREQQKTNNPFL